MFVITLTKNKLIMWAVAAGAVLCLLILALSLFFGRAPGAVSETIKLSGISTGEKRIEFISLCGYSAAETPAEILEITIPADFDDVFTEYNELQKQQGFDLSEYRGKRVRRYTYSLPDYPDAESGSVFATLYIYKDKVIGADIHSNKLDGFICPLVK